MIERSKIDKISNIIFGLAAIADGLIRVLSLGFLHTRFCLNLARAQAKRRFERMMDDNCRASEPTT